MKILMLGFAKIKYMPYMKFYFENIDILSNDLHLLYWNRDLKVEDTSFLAGVKLHEFCCAQEDDVSKTSKVSSFLKYRRYVKSILNVEKFDLIIVLHSLPGVLICDQLQKMYKNKYIFDYRDSTYEKFKVYKTVIGKLVKGSRATFVSSDAFRKYLPINEKNKIFTSHNILVDSLTHRDEKEKHGVLAKKIRIAFWGFIRHESINCEMIRKIAKDDRFELHYYGREQQVAINLKRFAKEIDASNVYFHGEYKPEERYEFVRNTDIIHNVYMDENMMLAMGNKYYDATIFYIPLMSMKGSFMAVKAKEARIGFEVNPYEDDFLDKLFEVYGSLDRNEFKKNCDKELQRVLVEYKLGSDLIKRLTDFKRKEE